MADCLFCSIAAGDIPASIVYSDDDLVAFTDIDPQAPTHVLVIPRTHHRNAAELVAADPRLAAAWLAAAGRVADDLGLGRGYRLVTNTGPDGGQSVDHAHLHVLGGRQLTWPPG